MARNTIKILTIVERNVVVNCMRKKYARWSEEAVESDVLAMEGGWGSGERKNMKAHELQQFCI